MFGGMNDSILPVQHHRCRQKGFGFAFGHHVLENFDLTGRKFVGFEGLPPAAKALAVREVCRIRHDVASFRSSISFSNRSSSRISSTSCGVADPQLAVA